MRFFNKVDDAIESILFRREKKKSIHRIVHQYRSTPYLKCTKGITSKCKEKKTINRKDKQYTMLQLELSLLTIINIAVYTE